MQLIYNQVKYMLIVLGKPFASILKHLAFCLTHQHNVEHAVVSDEYVRCRILHVEAVPHLGTVPLHAGHVKKKVLPAVFCCRLLCGIPSFLKT